MISKKHFSIFLFVFGLLKCLTSDAQLRNVIVEKYYVSDSNDATDTTDGRSIDIGSNTYRIYIDLDSGYKLKKIYGDSNHALKIESTSNFFNNIDRPSAYFGYLMNKNWFPDNPTLALDSWLTLGLAERTHKGILKTEDSDGSFIGGSNNGGGSSAIAGGIIVNNDPSAGTPLTVEDGLSPINENLSQWLDDGFKDGATDTTVFGSVNQGASFISHSAFLQQNSGVIGAAPDSNKILVAQLTTTGTISFELNIEVMDSDGISHKYVANDSNILPDETVSPYLKYPVVCGCKDPQYLEYRASYACNIPDSCHTLIVFGCMDTMACNYDPNANFNVPALCCYPGYCNDRNLAVVCPSLNSNRIRLYPNPGTEELNVEIETDNYEEISYEIYDGLGRMMTQKNLGASSGWFSVHVDISQLNVGLYMFRLRHGNNSMEKTFMKN